MYKVNEEKWQEIVYYINNFFLPIQYTTGRGIYPDRLTLVRSKNLNKMFSKDTEVEFAILNARAFDSAQKINLSREMVEKHIRIPNAINEIINVDNTKIKDYTKLFHRVSMSLINSKTTDYEKLNNYLISAYKLLDENDAKKIALFRENAFDVCVAQNIMSAEFCSRQTNLLKGNDKVINF